jgi:hypothetical protein
MYVINSLCRYYDATSEWTLDYPPFFAWFEWTLAHFAQFFDKQMLVLSNLEYASDATIMFQRLSVTVTSLVLAWAVLHATKHDKDNVKGLSLTFLILANAGMIMVDNIHFQYNSILLGGLVRKIWRLVCVLTVGFCMRSCMKWQCGTESHECKAVADMTRLFELQWDLELPFNQHSRSFSAFDAEQSPTVLCR